MLQRHLHKGPWAGSGTIAADQVVIVPLNLDDAFSGSAEEFSDLSRQLMLALKAGKTIDVSCMHDKLAMLQNIIDNASETDMDFVQLSEYCRQKKLKGQYIADVVTSLFSGPAQDAWGDYLVGEADWKSAFGGILAEFSRKIETGLIKIDVWRTAAPLESAPIFVSDDELKNILTVTNFRKKIDLAVGTGWIAVDELPKEIILRKVFPRILIALNASWKNYSMEQFESALQLSSWHVGLG